LPGGVQVRLESVLPCSADTAWEEVQKTALLAEIAWPLITFGPADDGPLPERWPNGGTVAVRSYMFGVLPLGTRTLTIEPVAPGARAIQTREHDPLIRRWDHYIRIDDAGANRCRYLDRVDIDAGVLTLPVWLFSQLLFRHRQRRWQRVAQRLSRVRTASEEPQR
jgi:hypothetical protein